MVKKNMSNLLHYMFSLLVCWSLSYRLNLSLQIQLSYSFLVA